MLALVAEPFVLASYPTASQQLPQSNHQQNTRGGYVSASCSSKPNGERCVTMSVQGDGIHVLELSSTHASVSHTLGPSAFFAAPAVTRFESSDVSTSYAVMHSAADGVGPKERGRTVWRWRDRQLSRPEDLPEPKISAVFPQPVECIWAPSAFPSHILAVSPLGQIMLADRDLHLISSTKKPDSRSILLRSWLFRSDDCTFLSRDNIHTGGIVVVCFVMVSSALHLRITLVQPTEVLKALAECDMGAHENITDISCDPSGYASVLTHTGQWESFRLGHDHAGTITTTLLTETVKLSRVISIPSSNGGGGRKSHGPTLLSVGSSHVLLAGITTGSSPEIVILLWDLQYSVVIASQTLAMPSAAAAYTPKSPPILELVSASKTQVLLVVSPDVLTGSQRKESVTPRRCTVFVVQLDVPLTSTIALAMGKARETQKWRQVKNHPSSHTEQNDRYFQLMQSMQSSIDQGQPQAAESSFFAWVEDETARLKQVQEKAPITDDYDMNSDDGQKAGDKSSAIKTMGQRAPTKPVLSHHFVSSILNMVLRPAKPSESIYSQRIVLYLVERKAVSHEMIEGGFIPSLKYHRDWTSIYSALRNIPDIPEAELVDLLAEVIKSHRKQQNPSDVNMQVDSPSNIPPLAQFLVGIVGYTTSPPALRLALKRHFTDVRDVVPILEVLERWVARWRGKSLGVETSTSTVLKPARQKVRPSLNDGMPSLENIIYFLQNVLDTQFLALLQYSACHDIITRLSEQFQELLSSIDEMDRMRGPLEFFIRNEAKEARLRRMRKEGEGDWRKKRKKVSQDTELAIGLYQIEELSI